MALRIGSLFSGYGGLDMGVAAALDEPSELAWVCEIDPAPSRILAHHYPDVPNHGDITKVQWVPYCPEGQEHRVRVWRFGPYPDGTDETVYRCEDVGCGWELPVDQRPAWVPYPVNIATAGFPCQDVSLAGGRAGLRAGTRSGLWSEVVRAVDALRPSLLIFENVRGLLSATAHSDVEPCPWCLGDDEDEPSLRALGAVAGDLAGLGYDLAWCGLRAADVGAPHGRFRVFGAAWPATQDANGAARGQWRVAAPGQAAGGRARTDARRRTGAPAPYPRRDTWAQDDPDRPAAPRSGGGVAADAASTRRAEPQEARAGSSHASERPWGGEPQRGRSAPVPDASGDGRHEGRPEPAGILGGPDAPLSGAGVAADPDSGELRDEPEPQPWRSGPPVVGDARVVRGAVPDTDGLGRRADVDQLRLGQPNPDRGNGRTDGDTPRLGVPDVEVGSAAAGLPVGPVDRAVPRDRTGAAAPGVHELGGATPVVAWGPYAAAVHRWERALGRVAPAPTERAPKGGQRLAPRFVEWMQGLPTGHVTDVPGLSRNEQLKALGNGVVPQQAEAAVRWLLQQIPALQVERFPRRDAA